MTKLLVSILVMGSALLLCAVDAPAAGQADPQLSPVAPPIVRGGDFAVRLVEVMGLGQARDEVEAESLLTSKGVIPRNGWIADYPMTPVVMGELRDAVVAGSQSGALPISETSAATSFDGLALELGMAPDQAAGQAYASGASQDAEPPPPIASYGAYPADYDTYYNDGPPIYTYYAPPDAYYGLYDWVPYPFFFTGIGFSGFFILHDFHRHRHWDNHFFGHGFHGDRFHNRFVSNHHFDPVLGRTARVRPSTTFRDASRATTVEARRGGSLGNGARSLDRNMGSRGTAVGEGRRDMLSSRGTERFQGRTVDRTFSGERVREGAGGSSRTFGGGDANASRSFRSFNGGGGQAFRSFPTFRGGDGNGFRTSQSFNGGGGNSFRSFHSSGSGGGGSFRSFGGGGGFSGRGGGGFSGGGFSGGGGRGGGGGHR